VNALYRKVAGEEAGAVAAGEFADEAMKR
jgi:hypothetical protein